MDTGRMGAMDFRSVDLRCVVVVMMMVVVGVRYAGSSCVRAGLCCEGHDPTCAVPRARAAGEDEDTPARSCFCDSGCVENGDCCDDYRQLCKPVDCVLADRWQEWQPCDVSCGPGIKRRIRHIIQAPRNGGRACGRTLQRSVCEGTRCILPRSSGSAEEIREIGKILPALFGRWRKSKAYNPFKDIRRNLFVHMDKSRSRYRPSYCATYEVTDVMPTCQLQQPKHPWTSVLSKGSSICVECQTVAMQEKLGGRCSGHGVYLRETRWAAVAVPGCHGTWYMKTRRRDCECDVTNSSFILV